MTDYVYRAFRASGSATEGRITAADAPAARRALRAQGLHPSDVTEAPAAVDAADGGAHGGPKPAALASWSARMAALLAGGVPLDKALAITLQGEAAGQMQASVQTMLAAVRDGAKPAEAARQAGLGPAAHGLLRAADATGDLAAAFGAIAGNTARIVARRRAIATALTYPALLVCVAIAAAVFMLTVIVPRFAPIFERAEANIPAMTRHILSLSAFVQAHWLPLLAGAVLLLLLLWLRLRRQDARADAIGLIGWLPGGRGVRRQLLLAQILGQFADFLAAGLTLPRALDLVRGTVGDGDVATRLGAVATTVETGGLLSDALADAQLLPGDLLSLVRAGEESGALVDMFRLAAETADAQAETAIRRLLLVLEPALILIIGVIIGGMILSIFQAVLSINDVAI